MGRNKLQGIKGRFFKFFIITQLPNNYLVINFFPSMIRLIFQFNVRMFGEFQLNMLIDYIFSSACARHYIHVSKIKGMVRELYKFK